MGLIKAALNAVGGNLADQYKEYIYCDSLPNEILAASVLAQGERTRVTTMLSPMALL